MVLRNIVQRMVEDVEVPHLAQRGVREQHRHLRKTSDALGLPPVVGCRMVFLWQVVAPGQACIDSPGGGHPASTPTPSAW